MANANSSSAGSRMSRAPLHTHSPDYRPALVLKTVREMAYHQAGRTVIYQLTADARPTSLNRICVALAGQLAEVIIEMLDDHFDLVDAVADVRYGKEMLTYAAEHDDAFKADLIGAGIDPGDWHIPVRHLRVTLRLLRETWSQVVHTADAMIQQATYRDA